MKFFSVITSSVGLALSAKKTMKVVEAATSLVETARERSELLAIAPEFARGADLLADLGLRLEKLDALLSGKKNPLVRERVALGVDTLRMMSAYYLHASQDEPFGDFAVRQGADIQRRWTLARDSVMQNRLAADAGAKSSGLTGLSDMFACMAVGALGVAARLQAKRLSEEGMLGDKERDELLSQARVGQQDAARFFRSNAMDKLSKMRAKGADPAKVAEASREFDEKAAQASLNGAGEVAQIQFFSGSRGDALDTLRLALGQLPPALLAAGTQSLAKELHWARGNDRVFCSWAADALGVGDPKVEGGKALAPKP